MGIRGQEQPAGTQSKSEELRALVEQVQLARRQGRQLEAEQALAEGRMQEQIARLEQQVAGAKVSLAAAQKENGRLREAIAADRGKAEAAAAAFEELLTGARGALSGYLYQPFRGVHGDYDTRLSAWLEAEKQWSASDLTTRAAGFADTCRLLQDELALAGSVQVWNAPVRPREEDREIQSFQLRLGLCQRYFVAEDGSEVGVWAKTPGAEAQWMTLDDPQDRKQVLQALDMLRERKTPNLVALPCVVRADRQEEAPRNE